MGPLIQTTATSAAGMYSCKYIGQALGCKLRGV